MTEYNLDGFVHFLLICKDIWTTICRMIADFKKCWGVGFLLLGGTFIIARWWVPSGICFTVAAYQYFTGHRLADWEDYQNGLEKENVGKPRPRDPIIVLIQRFIRRQS